MPRPGRSRCCIAWCAGASPERVVLNGAAGAAGRFPRRPPRIWLRDGAEAITTNCGFLSLFQQELAAHVRVPVATSALMQVPWVQATLPPGQRVGVITVSAASLTPRHLEAVGVPLGYADRRHRARPRILPRADPRRKPGHGRGPRRRRHPRRRAELSTRHPDVGAIVLECTNMPPYAFALRETLGLPVYDIYSLVTWLHAGLRPREFGPPADRATCLGGMS